MAQGEPAFSKVRLADPRPPAAVSRRRLQAGSCVLSTRWDLHRRSGRRRAAALLLGAAAAAGGRVVAASSANRCSRHSWVVAASTLQALRRTASAALRHWLLNGPLFLPGCCRCWQPPTCPVLRCRCPPSCSARCFPKHERCGSVMLPARSGTARCRCGWSASIARVSGGPDVSGRNEATPGVKPLSPGVPSNLCLTSSRITCHLTGCRRPHRDHQRLGRVCKGKRSAGG